MGNLWTPDSSASSRLFQARLPRRRLLAGVGLGAGALLVNRLGLRGASAATGPSTAVEPYMLPSVNGVRLTSILTVGDKPAVNGYRMVGIPDGLGAFANNDGNFTLVMNHELVQNTGIARKHGSNGAFNSRWTIDRKTLQVYEGADLTPSDHYLYQFDPATGKYYEGTTAWQRLCSGDLAKPSAFSFGNLGTTDHIMINGEEVNGGRAWGRVVDGAYAGGTWQLPRMGTNSYENLVASPRPSEKTMVVCLDDGSINTAPIAANYPCEVSVYVGTKQASGNPVERAGLTNGKLYGVRVWRAGTLVTEESSEFGLGNASTTYVGGGLFELVELGDRGDVSALTGLQQEEAMVAKNITRFLRTEDGAWDPRPSRANDFYFVTTNSFSTPSRLWRLRFNDIENPEQGGRIDIIRKGTEGHRMLDNVTIDKFGRILMDEDPGNEPHNAKLWLYSIDTGKLIQIASHNPRLFEASYGAPEFLTQDEESSGIIDAEHVLGEGWFLFDIQAHKSNPDPELVEYGQLLALYVDPSVGRV